jgi:SAM-dependent methyltransferase
VSPRPAGPAVEFGAAADDYATHRQGFPPSFFARLPLTGRVLDLGTGTGTLAAGYAARGADVIALDYSRTMLAAAPASLARVVARAEAIPLADASIDAIVAGQCWHWFDGPRAAAECARVVRPGGAIAIVHLDYTVEPGGIGEATEALILARNPGWPLAGGVKSYEPRWRPHLEGAGLVEVEVWSYVEPLRYTHAAWRGRIRACNGVLAVADPAGRAAIDAELATLLADHPDPVEVPHRIFAITARRPE